MQPPEWDPPRFIMRPGWGAGTLSLPGRLFLTDGNQLFFASDEGLAFGKRG
jgi:hypothetical protein